MWGDSKYLFSFLGDKFSEPVHTIKSLGCRQLGNSKLLIGLPGNLRWTKCPAVRNIHQNATNFLKESDVC